MHASIITSAVFVAAVAAQSITVPVTGILGNDTVVENNPVGVVYTAELPEDAFSYPGPQGNVKGSISATANANGVGLKWTVNRM